jgi:hypothetical protein
MTETATPAPLAPQHVPALAKMVGDADTYGPSSGWVEAGTAYGFRYATLVAMSRQGYVTMRKRVQASLHCRSVTYWTAELTEAGRAAYAAHLAAAATSV